MNVSGKPDEKKTNKSCSPLHIHHTQVLTPALRMWVTWVFWSPGFNLFNLARLWFAYLLTSRCWQPWPPGSLQKLSGMPEGTLTRNIQTHLQSCGQLASKLLIASVLLLLPLVYGSFSSVRKEVLEWFLLKPLPSYFLPLHKEVWVLLKAQHQEGVGGKWNNFLWFSLSCIQEALHVLSHLSWELEKQSRGSCPLLPVRGKTCGHSVFCGAGKSACDGWSRRQGKKPAAGRGSIVAFKDE